LKELNNISNQSVNLNTLQVENDIISESNVQDGISSYYLGSKMI